MKVVIDSQKAHRCEWFQLCTRCGAYLRVSERNVYVTDDSVVVDCPSCDRVSEVPRYTLPECSERYMDEESLGSSAAESAVAVATLPRIYELNWVQICGDCWAVLEVGCEDVHVTFEETSKPYHIFCVACGEKMSAEVPSVEYAVHIVRRQRDREDAERRLAALSPEERAAVEEGAQAYEAYMTSNLPKE